MLVDCRILSISLYLSSNSKLLYSARVSISMFLALLVEILCLLSPVRADHFDISEIPLPGPESRKDCQSDKGTEEVRVVLERVGNHASDIFGPIPEQAYEAWCTVVQEIDDGSLKLEEIMRHYTTSARDQLRSESENSDEWDLYVTSDKFPEHQLRMKDPANLGIDNTRQLSGYMDIGKNSKKHLFFWFFESRNDPENSPVVLWLNGGAGSSSFLGLFFELGPSFISPELKPIHNKHAWNQNTNMIFLDQPAGVGYSYNEGKDVPGTVKAGQDVYAFLELFFQEFPQYLGNEFHIAGESYAGHYIPVFGREIISHDDRSFNLTSLLIGNGLTDPLHQYDAYEKMACGMGGYPAVLDEQECQKMRDALPKCDELIESCYSSGSTWVCVPAAVYCNNITWGPVRETGRNVYDLSKSCEGNGLCYSQFDDIEHYLNLDFVKRTLGTEIIKDFKMMSSDVYNSFFYHGDWMKPYFTAVTDLLEAGVPQLYYSGDLDFSCNWVGNENWTRALMWSGHKKFAETPLTPWVLMNGTIAGEKRNYRHFTFLRVFGAGHMVPYDQPESSLEMFERWIRGDYELA